MDPSMLTTALQRIERSLRAGWAHYLYLLILALAVYGHTLAFGLIYDDAILLDRAGPEWISHPWVYAKYYRPLQLLLFHPSVVSPYPPLLHFQNIAVGALVVFLFGTILSRLGRGFWERLTVESIGIALPTSMMSFVWISQRTEWFTTVLALWLVVLSFSRLLSARTYVVVFMLLTAIAFFAKESAVSILFIVPAFVFAYHRRRRLGIWLALTGILAFVAYWWARGRILPEQPAYVTDPLGLAGAAVIGLIESAVFSYVQVCFTYNPLYLALNLTFMAIGVAGAAAMLRRNRSAAGALLLIFFGMAAGTAPIPEPRNLMVPGLVAVAFAAYGVRRIQASEWKPAIKRIATLVAVVNVLVLWHITVFFTYPLQNWIESANRTIAENRGDEPPRGNRHEIDVNNRFHTGVRQWLKGRYYARRSEDDSTATD